MANAALTITKLEALTSKILGTSDKVSLNHVELGLIKTMFNNVIGTISPFQTGLQTYFNGSLKTGGTISYKMLAPTYTEKDKVDCATPDCEPLEFVEQIFKLNKPKYLCKCLTAFDSEKGLGQIANDVDSFLSQIMNKYWVALYTALTKVTAADGTVSDLTIGDITATGKSPREQGELLWQKIGDVYSTIAAGITINGVKVYPTMDQIVVSVSPKAMSKLVLSGIVGNEAKDAYESGINFVGRIAGFNIVVNPVQTIDLIIGLDCVLIADLDIIALNVDRAIPTNDMKLYIEWAVNIFKTVLATSDTLQAFNLKTV